MKVKVPPANPVTVAVPPSHVGVIVKLGSSAVSTVTSWVELCGHVPAVVYSIVYVVADVPPVTSPVAESITAPSVGTGFNVNIPPVSPVIVAVPPSQVGVIVKLGSSAVSTVTS